MGAFVAMRVPVFAMALVREVGVVVGMMVVVVGGCGSRSCNTNSLMPEMIFV